MSFIRTCQSCGYELHCTPPSKDRELSDAYRNRKCPKCKSEDFDYGSERTNGEGQPL